MNSSFRFIFLALSVTAVLLVSPSSAGSCIFRCSQIPTPIDYMHPIGCYCHATCGGKLPCCFDKRSVCDGGCQAPKKVHNADIVGISKLLYTKGETIKYECDFHYKMSGSDTRTCMGNNIWTPRPPSCRYLTFVCRPPSIEDGKIASKPKKQYETGESVTVECERGFELHGASRLTCTGYTWSKFLPSCYRKRCDTTSYCSPHSTCKNTRYRAVCSCNEGYTGSGYTCNKIPCYEHNCASEEVCVDRDGEDSCECKEGYIRSGSSCVVDPCANNDCHEDATCSVVDGNSVCSCNEGYKGNGTNCEVDPCFENNCHENAICEAYGKEDFSCYCDEGYKGNGTYCEVAKCNPGDLYNEDQSIVGMCDKCEETCCDPDKLRECRICIHMKCNDGEVCGEEGLSRVPTVCIDKKCYENRDSGFTVEAPSRVHCLDEKGLQKEGMSCCWVGE